MNTARIIVVVVGIFLPYLVRLPGGEAWVRPYTDVGVIGFLFFGAFNALVWGSILGLSFVYRRTISLLVPSLLGFGFLAWAHYSLDLAADAQAAIVLIFIPVFALPLVAVGGALGYWLDRRLRRDDREPATPSVR